MEIKWIKDRMPEEDSNLLTNECCNSYWINNSTVTVLVITDDCRIYQTTRVKPSMHWERQSDGDFCRVRSSDEAWRWREDYNCFDVYDKSKNSSNIIAWAYNPSIKDIEK